MREQCKLHHYPRFRAPIPFPRADEPSSGLVRGADDFSGVVHEDWNLLTKRLRAAIMTIRRREGEGRANRAWGVQMGRRRAREAWPGR